VSLKTVLLGHLGHCGECMRTSFVAAVAAWAVFAALRAAVPSATIQTLSVLAAIASSLLWLAHIVVFAWRVSRAAPSPQRIASASRREFVPLFIRTLTLGAAMTAFPGAITSAFGEKLGPCDHCARFKGSDRCWACCRCQNSNNVAGCKKQTNPDKYNKCLADCTTSFENCNKACQ
jgi:hypothetical protein